MTKAELPQFDRIVYVSKAGSDDTGTGAFNEPFATIAMAMAAIGPLANPDVRYCVEVRPGVYNGFQLLPDVWVIGTTPTLTEIAGPITIAPSPAGPQRRHSGLYSLRFSSPQVLDMSVSPSLYMILEDCSFIENLRIKAVPENSLFFSNSFLFGGYMQVGGFASLSGVANQNGGTMNITAAGDTTFLAYGSQSNGPISALATEGNPLLFTLGAFALQDEASLTLDGPMVVQVSPGCLPRNVTVRNGAPSPRPVFTGSRSAMGGGVVALVSMFAGLGLITDGTTP